MNPLPRTCGELIDAAGLRGARLGTAEVSTKHANFIQADADLSTCIANEATHLPLGWLLDDDGRIVRSEAAY